MNDLLDASPAGPPPSRMRTPYADRPRVRRGLLPYAVAAAGVAVACVAGVLCAVHVHPQAGVHRAALFVHLASLVLGFGAVLAVDWVAMRWVAGQRSLADVLAVASEVQVPIWVGYSGLVLSGVLLEPDLANPLTQLKLVLVVLIGWNGVLATWLHHRLDARPGEPGRALMLVSCSSAAVSQTGWWGAMLIGFVNHG